MTLSPTIHFQGSASIADRVLFSDLDFSIEEGKTTCLLGESGVGKSTILRLIAGLETGVAFSGAIRSSDNVSLDDRLGYMAQGSELFPWLNVLDNVLLGSKLRGEEKSKTKALDFIAQVGMSAHIDRRPSALSGGEKQRVALARTLMEDRPIVLLDEPFSALDAKTRSEMQELAGLLLRDKTVLLITHDPSEAARLGDEIFILSATSLLQIEAPASPPVRAFDDSETLQCQGRLYRLLRGGAL